MYVGSEEGCKGGRGEERTHDTREKASPPNRVCTRRLFAGGDEEDASDRDRRECDTF